MDLSITLYAQRALLLIYVFNNKTLLICNDKAMQWMKFENCTLGIMLPNQWLAQITKYDGKCAEYPLHSFSKEIEKKNLLTFKIIIALNT